MSDCMTCKHDHSDTEPRVCKKIDCNCESEFQPVINSNDIPSVHGVFEHVD